MPTGYTAAVGEGKVTTLREFALQCARGMGACIMMRDEPWDAPIPERFAPSTEYHDKRLAEARDVLANVPNYTPKMCENMAASEWLEAAEEHNKYALRKAEENRRYHAMISEVLDWHTEAEGIKEFMLQQLRISIDDYVLDAPKKLSGPEWRAAKLAKAQRDIEYHEREIAAEIARTEARNKWLADLRASLPAA